MAKYVTFNPNIFYNPVHASKLKLCYRSLASIYLHIVMCTNNLKLYGCDLLHRWTTKTVPVLVETQVTQYNLSHSTVSFFTVPAAI